MIIPLVWIAKEIRSVRDDVGDGRRHKGAALRSIFLPCEEMNLYADGAAVINAEDGRLEIRFGFL